MTPKEKAQQLTDKMGNIPDGGFGSIGLYEAKQCALIVVDEILKAFEVCDCHFVEKELEYWLEVKQELDKL
jgi:hypothetical protein